MADYADVINMPLDCDIRLDPQSVPAPDRELTRRRGQGASATEPPPERTPERTPKELELVSICRCRVGLISE